ncbi:hypothetical protein PSACC_01629 [Paramicrosporidium saccamoebae]|uniref:Uncharacterized protein n=1 Tax=Paramicrosporidium saccamoebae TaxID=1246581 RepID=A0A2H9TLD0_9FUNG|nr:hypothetical protein PSACC_01629 [Paramicrosporidium saccamoebae]
MSRHTSSDNKTPLLWVLIQGDDEDRGKALCEPQSIDDAIQELMADPSIVKVAPRIVGKTVNSIETLFLVREKTRLLGQVDLFVYQKQRLD